MNSSMSLKCQCIRSIFGMLRLWSSFRSASAIILYILIIVGSPALPSVPCYSIDQQKNKLNKLGDAEKFVTSEFPFSERSGKRKGDVAKLRAKAKAVWRTENLPQHYEGTFRVFRDVKVNFLTGEVQLQGQTSESFQDRPVEYQVAIAEFIGDQPRRVRWMTDNRSGQTEPDNSTVHDLMVELALREDGRLHRMTTARPSIFSDVKAIADMERLFVNSLSLHFNVLTLEDSYHSFSWVPESTDPTFVTKGEVEFFYGNDSRKSALRSIRFSNWGVGGLEQSHLVIDSDSSGKFQELTVHDFKSDENALRGLVSIPSLADKYEERSIDFLSGPDVRDEMNAAEHEVRKEAIAKVDQFRQSVAFGTTFKIPLTPNNMPRSMPAAFERLTWVINHQRGPDKVITSALSANVGESGGQKLRLVELHKSEFPHNTNPAPRSRSSKPTIRKAKMYFDQDPRYPGVRPILSRFDTPLRTGFSDKKNPTYLLSSEALDEKTENFHLNGSDWTLGSADWFQLNFIHFFNLDSFVQNLLIANLALAQTPGSVQMLRPWKTMQRNYKKGRVYPSDLSSDQSGQFFSVATVTEVLEANGRSELSEEGARMVQFMAPPKIEFSVLKEEIKNQFPETHYITRLPRNSQLYVVPLEMKFESAEIFALIKKPELQTAENNYLVHFLSGSNNPHDARAHLLAQLKYRGPLEDLEMVTVADYVGAVLSKDFLARELLCDQDSVKSDSVSTYTYLAVYDQIAPLFALPKKDRFASNNNRVLPDLAVRMKLQQEILALFPSWAVFTKHSEKELWMHYIGRQQEYTNIANIALSSAINEIKSFGYRSNNKAVYKVIQTEQNFSHRKGADRLLGLGAQF